MVVMIEFSLRKSSLSRTTAVNFANETLKLRREIPVLLS